MRSAFIWDRVLSGPGLAVKQSLRRLPRRPQPLVCGARRGHFIIWPRYPELDRRQIPLTAIHQRKIRKILALVLDMRLRYRLQSIQLARGRRASGVEDQISLAIQISRRFSLSCHSTVMCLLTSALFPRGRFGELNARPVGRRSRVRVPVTLRRRFVIEGSWILRAAGSLLGRELIADDL